MDPSLSSRIHRAVLAWPEHPGPALQLRRLTGDASNRIYVRIGFAQGTPPTAMAMILPEEPGPAEEFGGGTAEQTELPFVTMARWLEARGLPVPAIYHVDRPTRIVLLEDLGDTTLERALDQGDREALYQSAVDLLVEFQVRTRTASDPIVASRPRMDRAVLAWELQHYVEWRLEADLGRDLAPFRAALSEAFEPLLDALCALPVRLIHRDFQSRNLMCDPAGGYHLIDFQDAMCGPYIYDLAALLRDSYVALEPGLLDGLVLRYAEGGRAAGLFELDDADIRRHFDLQSVQRKLKDTGRFVFIDRIKRNPSFLPYRAPSMAYVRAALARLDELAPLRELLAELDPP